MRELDAIYLPHISKIVEYEGVDLFVGLATAPKEAFRLGPILELKINGLEFLERLMPQYPIPVVVSGSGDSAHENTLPAFEAGAIDFVPKPSSMGGYSRENMLLALRTKIKIAAKADVSHWKEKWDWRKMARQHPTC